MVEWIYKLTDISSIKRISFRQDINGLRAIAVLAVVFYHAELELFKGGWLGVDIFFVISGYLISNIIISELNDGTFSFKNFYLRRVRRILPALFSTLLLTIPFAYFFLTPKAMDEYIDSLVASVFFYANYHFMNLDFYVAESTKLMPLLHTWSLAIEEQYYLLFPLLAFLVYKYFKKYFTFFIGFITVGSLYLNTLSQSTEKFYRLEFRIWELLLGVLVMILSNNFKIKHLEKIGLPLMLFPIFYFDDYRINDSEPKLIALIGIALIIFSNIDSSMLSKVFSFKLISIIGLSSYSIYLLHQPVFAFYRIYKLSIWENYITNSIDESSIEKILLIFFIVFLSTISYIFIELKFIKIKYSISIVFLFLILILFAIGFKEYLIEYKVKLNEIPTIHLQLGDEDSGLLLEGRECHNFTENDISNLLNPCIFNPGTSNKVYVVGDSHLKSLNTLVKSSKNYNFSLIPYTRGGCLLQIEISFRQNDCGGEVINIYKEKVNNIRDSIIIYGGRFPLHLTEKRFFNGYIQEEGDYGVSNGYSLEEKMKSIENTINSFIQNGNKIILIYPIPEQGWNVRKLYISETIPWSKDLGYSYNIFKNRTQTSYDVLDSISSKDLYRVYPENIFCNTFIRNQCVGKFKDKLFYQDDDHLAPDGEELLSQEILKVLELILSK